MGALLRHRDLRLLTIGLSASMAGDSLMLLVFAIWVKTLTGSNGAAALVLLCIAAPCAIAPLGGWLLDRVPHRRFLVIANIASALTLLPLLEVRDRTDVWIIYLVASLYGVLFVATAAALNGLLKDLLAEELLATANGALQTIKEGLRVAGPLAGAALLATMGGATVALIDAATFLIAAASIAAIGLRDRPPVRAELPWPREMSAGLRHLMTDAALRRTMTASAIAWLVIGLTESVSFAVVDQGLHRPPEFIGVLACAQGAGSIAGGLGAARIIGRAGEMSAIALGLCLFGAGAGLCMITSLPIVLAGKTVTGLGFAISMVGFVTILQRRTPTPLLGRVSTAAETFTSGPQTISIAIGAALITAVDYRLLLAIISAGMLTAAIHLWPQRRLTTPETRQASVVPTP
jgi:MFS family permease